MAASPAATWDTVTRFHKAAAELAEARASGSEIDLYGNDSGETAGDVLVRSQQFADWTARFPGGIPSAPGPYNSDPIELPGGLRTLVTLNDASAGALVPPAQSGLLDDGLYRAPSVINLIPRRPVASDQVQYAVEASHVESAAPVSEAAALTGTTGTKPEGGLAFSLVTQEIRTFAVWLPVTRNVLADASALRSHVDAYLSASLIIELEDQIISGDGLGMNFVGVLNAPGTLTQTAPGSGESMLHVVRKAQTKVQTQGRTNPNAVVIHPNDSEKIDLLEKNNEDNFFVSDPFSAAVRPLWGMSRVVSDAMPEGTAVVGDFSRCTLFDREATTIMIGSAGDDFIRNIVRVRAELRAGFGVIRPKAFAIVDLAA
jgi:HK97 family phage major capsid protein